MASLFQRFLAWLTGRSGSVVIPPASQPAASPAEKPTTTPEPTPSGSEQMQLARKSSSADAATGKLSFGGVSATTEESAKRLAAGSYTLELREEGGLHSAYWFRFPDHHKGMIVIKDPTFDGFRYLRLGESAADTQGGIVIPNIGEYLDIYTRVADAISTGKHVSLVVS